MHLQSVCSNTHSFVEAATSSLRKLFALLLSFLLLAWDIRLDLGGQLRCIGYSLISIEFVSDVLVLPSACF